MHGPSLLLPLALAQGLLVAGRAPRLPPPVGNGGRFGRDRRAPLRVVGVGDSIIAGTGVRRPCDSLTGCYARRLHRRSGRDVEWRVHGTDGATSAMVLHKVAPAVPSADVYLLSCGVNDAVRGVTPARFGAHLAEILALLRRKSPDAFVLHGGLPPLDSFPALPWPLKSVLAARAQALQAEASARLAEDARSRIFRFPPALPPEAFSTDGFHPGERGCDRWAAGLLGLCPELGRHPTVAAVA